MKIEMTELVDQIKGIANNNLDTNIDNVIYENVIFTR